MILKLVPAFVIRKRSASLAIAVQRCVSEASFSHASRGETRHLCTTGRYLEYPLYD